MISFVIDHLSVFMFLVLIPMLFTGLPVAFVLGGVGFIFWLIAVWIGLENGNSFFLVVSRIFGGVVAKTILVAVPMFIFMGTMLEKSGIARDLLNSLQKITRRAPGGLALSVTLLGVILAATTGIIGASVVMMTLMALPVMLERGYSTPLATGTIAASGTLGILLPPSIMLVVMADLLSISAGTLFLAAIGPSLLLALLYFLYIGTISTIKPDAAPPFSKNDADTAIISLVEILKSFLPPLLLILAVLGSIFAGIATPTEASGIGAFGALILATFRKKLNKTTLSEVLEGTVLTSTMIFTLFVWATAFSYVFTLLGGHDFILSMINQTGISPWAVLISLMLAVFTLGFFFDWIEITLIILPVFAPVITALDFGTHIALPGLTVAWFAVLMAVNLQTSFLTPPFGFALFYLKGAAPKSVKIQAIYRGIIPFVILQLIGLTAILLWPEVALWLPGLKT